MKIVVIVRQTPDTEAKIAANSSGNGIDETGLKWILNPFDEFAVEEAVKIKESTGAEVVILGIGPDRALETIRTALAMGGDSAIHIKDENFGATDSYATAKLIASKIKAMGDVDLILAGKKWIDEESGQVAIQVAAGRAPLYVRHIYSHTSHHWNELADVVCDQVSRRQCGVATVEFPPWLSKL